MYYYEVLPASQRYHGNKPLTYGSEEELAVGRVAVVPLQRQKALGVITKRVEKPAFATKQLERVLPAEVTVPGQLAELVRWLSDYYPAPLGQIMSLLLPTTLQQQSRKQKAKEQTEASKAISPPVLTQEQKKIVSAIKNSSAKMHLLHGDTGTGKTRVYLELIADALAKNKSCIVLTPEIGLTPQLTMTLEQAFPGKTVVLHSELTPAERRNRWLGIAGNEKPQIIIGPRSALFAPLHDIGLIILDEAHDSAYKQEQAPHYLASRVAAKLADLHGAKVILGTATPLIQDYFTFVQKGLPIHRMKETAVKSTFTSDTELVSLKDRSLFSRSNWLSTPLIQSIEETLRSGGQALIFLNRRGSARLVSCQQCGWQAVCSRCDIPMTYHGDKHHMLCHTCGYRTSAPASCPSCSSTEIAFKSIGTKAIATELEKLFPDKRLLRFDSDNNKADRLETQYETVRAGEVDIIVGTQLLAKGLDLPNLGLVGIVVADSSLFFPDYTAEERTYQLISQVIGRTGRGHRNSKVIVQTYHPDNQTLLHALAGNYEDFYNDQIRGRQRHTFPPYRYTLKIRVERASSSAAERAINTVRNSLAAAGLKIELSDPAPAFIEKIHNRYRWQLIAGAVDRNQLTKAITILPANTLYDIDPLDML